MRSRVLVLLSVVLAMGVTLALSQTKKPLTNGDVVQMVKAGFQESMIVKAIEANDTNFDVSVQALMDLKNAGVSQAIIEAMLSAEAKKKTSESAKPSSGPAQLSQTPPMGATSPAPAIAVGRVALAESRAATSGAQSQDPWPEEVAGMDREVGIYYKREGKFVALYGKPVVATETGGFIKTGLTMGLSKIRRRGQLPGKHAQLQVSERQPTFYFCTPEGQTPDSFTLIRMEEKGDRRQFQVGSAGGVTGRSTAGLKVGAVTQTHIERIAPRVYRVMPDGELHEGEYGYIGTFTYTAVGVAGAGEKIYDFGITKKK